MSFYIFARRICTILIFESELYFNFLIHLAKFLFSHCGLCFLSIIKKIISALPKNADILNNSINDGLDRLFVKERHLVISS